MGQAQTYLTLFLSDNEQLINHLAAYNNIMLSSDEIINSDRDSKVKLESFSPAQADAIMQTIGFFRSYTVRTYIRFNSIKGDLNADKKQVKSIEDNYKIITGNLVPSFKSCSEYVQTLNDILTQNINAKSAMDRAGQTKELTDMASVSDIIEDE